MSKRLDLDLPSGECVVGGVLDVDNVERARVTFARGYGTDATQIVTTSDHDQVARVELDVVLDLVVLQVEADGVVDLDVRVRVTDRTAVVGHNHWHSLRADQQLLDLAQLVLQINTKKISFSNVLNSF